MTQSKTTGEKFAEHINENLENATASAHGQVNKGQKVSVAIEVENGRDTSENFKPHKVLDLEENFDYSILAGSGWATTSRYTAKYSVEAKEQDYREAVQDELVEIHQSLNQTILKAHQCRDMDRDEEQIKELRNQLQEVMEDNREEMSNGF